jgi:hypothetical protein
LAPDLVCSCILAPVLEPNLIALRGWDVAASSGAAWSRPRASGALRRMISSAETDAWLQMQTFAAAWSALARRPVADGYRHHIKHGRCKIGMQNYQSAV